MDARGESPEDNAGPYYLAVLEEGDSPVLGFSMKAQTKRPNVSLCVEKDCNNNDWTTLKYLNDKDQRSVFRTIDGVALEDKITLSFRIEDGSAKPKVKKFRLHDNPP